MLGRVSQRKSFFNFRRDINPKSHLLETTVLLLALSFGIQDSATYPIFQCFASNQTGNTVLFAIHIFHLTSDDRLSHTIVPIAISLGAFLAGAIFFGQVACLLRSVRRKWWLLVSSSLQTAIVASAAGIQLGYAAARKSDTPIGRAALALQAVAAGGQVSMVRGLMMSDLTTTMATAALVDVLIDPQLFAAPAKNIGRNRRVGFLIALVAGSFIGAAVYKNNGPGLTLMVGFIIKALATGMLLFNSTVPDDEEGG
ncbi:uncharacterized protein K452DRAFT_282589 [Aplosporella prunicola CBS 121167]|uniref:DUF1275 domain protein n=1 Tax=Aplosporella prunicola CBS 121167 TaxID=1176127 RepID=A0A6A6BU07_9PEZI|nr:uncharacterized protein K452DRAFT_282589 [Aplosporella prunicola CBS 121167]KAF2147592.1 hypothetical protein K452DRAFT_282589 [Aplosporella prunicola CBS 121167]